MATPLVVWDRRMLGYDLGGHHPLHPLRWDLTWALAGELGVLDAYDVLVPNQADDQALGWVHTPGYIAAVRAASSAVPMSVGHGLGTDDNPIFPGMHDNAALIAGGSIDAARAIAHGEVDRAVNFCGGLHHAMPDHASGFCVYNDAALGIRAMLDAGVRRVAYVDVDAHHGDGVQAAFYDDPRVLTISLHESPLSLFPGTGWPAELGVGAAQGTAVNLPLPAGTGDAAWLRAFHAVVPGLLRAFRPEVLVTQQGADGHREDPLADLMLTVDGQRTTYLALRELAREITGGRWLALGGGGYSPVRVVPRAWTHLLAIVADKDLDPGTPLPPDWLARAAEARPDVPLPIDMSEGEPGVIVHEPWAGHQEMPVDRAILQTREAVYPLHGLDPRDPRD
ncbi:MAG TPA: acetoin utilization protein AcuC [Nakamurella sp.]